jgi:hypothetical protein
LKFGAETSYYLLFFIGSSLKYRAPSVLELIRHFSHDPRDDDHIGKDDFDGECFIDLGLIPENQTVQWDVQLRARPNKKKEKIDGHVTVELYIISDKLREQLGSKELKATSAQRLSLDTRRKDEESK